jgi:hypothetical protein
LAPEIETIDKSLFSASAFTTMSDFGAIYDAIKKQYGFDEWGKNIAPNLLGKALTLGLRPSVPELGSFALERRVELPEDAPGFRAHIEYYKNTANKEARFAVTILENETVQQAHEELAEELAHSMAPSLPLAENKNIHVGHIAFTVHGPVATAVKFVRGNLFIKVESIGTKNADVKYLAEAIDRNLLSILREQ